MLFANTETTWQMVWMSGIAAALVIIPILANAFTAWLQTRSLNASGKDRSDKLGRQMDQQSEQVAEEVATKLVEKVGTGSALFPQGEQGEQGDKGYKGDRGEKGEHGDRGAKGEKGATGGKK